MYNTRDYVVKTVRIPAALTDTYVADTILTDLQNSNQLVLYVDLTKGSIDSMQWKVEFAPEDRISLAYDGQTTNFAVGEVVVGAVSGARGMIVKDTDAGATGTLILNNWQGVFTDNEALVGSIAGAAVVNGAQSATGFYQEAAETISAGTATNRELEHTIVAANQSAATQLYRFAVPLTDRIVKISFKGTGTMTGSVCSAYVVAGAN